MFSLHDIDTRIGIFTAAAEDLESQAEKAQGITGASLRCYAAGLRDAAGSLARMIEHTIEQEARDAIERGVV